MCRCAKDCGLGGDSVMLRCFCLQNDETAFLIDAVIAVVFAEQLDEFRTAQVARQFHEEASTSSRTRWRRTRAGLG